MNRFTEYKIPFQSYSNGRYEFEFGLNEEFFELFPDNEIRVPRINARVTLVKQERQVEIEFHLQGSLVLACDRCLGDYIQQIEGDYMLYGKYGTGRNEEEYDTFWISPDMHYFDVSQYLYEFVILSLPMRRVHPDLARGKPGCDPEMLGLLGNFSVNK